MLAEAILSGPPSDAQADLILTGEVRANIRVIAERFLNEWDEGAELVGLTRLHMVMTAMGAGIFWGLRVGE